MQTTNIALFSYRAFELHDGGFSDGENRQFQLGFQTGDFGTSGGGFEYGFRISQTDESMLLFSNTEEPTLFVVKLDLSDVAASDEVTVWQNPSLLTGLDPAGGVSMGGLDLTFDRITFARFGNGGPTSWDELRVGSTFADVTTGGVVSDAVGDFNGDGIVDCDDLNSYVGNLGSDATGALAQLDLDGDTIITLDDANQHIATLVATSNGQIGTFPGDVNCDGAVNVLGDAFVLVGNLGQAVSAYTDGDLNFDGSVSVLGDAFILVGNLGMDNSAP